MVSGLLDDDGLLRLGKRSSDPAVAVDEIRGARQEMPAQNEALRDWTAPADPPTAACHLCGRPPRIRCKACQRGACSSDSWVMLGLCRSCATEERMKASHHERRVSGNWLE